MDALLAAGSEVKGVAASTNGELAAGRGSVNKVPISMGLLPVSCAPQPVTLPWCVLYWPTFTTLDAIQLVVRNTFAS